MQKFKIYNDDLRTFNEFCKSRGDKAEDNIRRAIIAALDDEVMFEEINKEEAVPFKKVSDKDAKRVCVAIDKELRGEFHKLTWHHHETVVAWVRKYVRRMNRLYEKKKAEQAKERASMEDKLWKL